MTGGFAFIAWPADYGKTGVMTFMVGPDGRILQRDLGENTDAIVRSILTYNPGPEWSEVK